MINSLKHPWQNGPTELIRYAIKHVHSSSDFDSRIAYLMLDVGIETLFKTYLTLPDDVTKVQTKFFERQQAAEGNFHELVRGVGKAANEKLKDFNLSHIQFYHDLRNKLYHQGNGITIPRENVYAYAKLATDLLKILLDVDLSEYLQQPEIDAQKNAELSLRQLTLENKKALVDIELQKLEDDLMLVVETITPKLALPSFQNNFLQVTNKYWVEFVSAKDENGNAIYASKITNNPDQTQNYYKELIELIRLSIENPELTKKLLEPCTYGFFDKKETIESVLLPIVSSGYPEAKDILFRVLELSISESSNWLRPLEEHEINTTVLDNPFNDEIEKYNSYLKECDELLIDIKNNRTEIKNWISSRVKNAA